MLPPVIVNMVLDILLSIHTLTITKIHINFSDTGSHKKLITCTSCGDHNPFGISTVISMSAPIYSDIRPTGETLELVTEIALMTHTAIRPSSSRTNYVFKIPYLTEDQRLALVDELSSCLSPGFSIRCWDDTLAILSPKTTYGCYTYR